MALACLLFGYLPLAARAEDHAKGGGSPADPPPMTWIARGEPSATLDRKARRPIPSVASFPFWMGIRVFQRFISPVDGPTCPMHPTCSRYAREAIQKHGIVLGLVMTADRLIRDNGSHKGYPIIRVHGFERYYDPVEANDFWYTKDAQPTEDGKPTAPRR